MCYTHVYSSYCVLMYDVITESYSELLDILKKGSMNKSFSSVFLKFLGKKSIGRRFINSVIFVCLTLTLWVTTMLFLYKELKKLLAVARVEHIDVTIIPEALNEIARNFTTYLFIIILGILSLLIYRFYQEIITEKNYRNENSDENKKTLE